MCHTHHQTVMWCHTAEVEKYFVKPDWAAKSKLCLGFPFAHFFTHFHIFAHFHICATRFFCNTFAQIIKLSSYFDPFKNFSWFFLFLMSHDTNARYSWVPHLSNFLIVSPDSYCLNVTIVTLSHCFIDALLVTICHIFKSLKCDRFEILGSNICRHFPRFLFLSFSSCLVSIITVLHCHIVKLSHCHIGTLPGTHWQQLAFSLYQSTSSSPSQLKSRESGFWSGFGTRSGRCQCC